MASSIALRRLTVPTLFARLHKPARCASIAPSLSCSFNTDTQLSRFDEDDSDVDVDRRCGRSFSRRRLRRGFYSDVVDPFSSTRSISQARALISKLMEEKNNAVQQNNKLRQELELLKRQGHKNGGGTGVSLLVVVLIGLLGIILGYLMKKA